MPKLAIASILGGYERILGAEHGLIFCLLYTSPSPRDS